MPGNVIGLVDFGMVGRIDDALREDLEDMLLAIGERDAARLTEVITRLGEVPRDLDRTGLGNDVADFVAHYGNHRLNRFNFSAALNEMTEIIRRYRIMLPARMAMLMKMLVMLEGTARLASPRFSLMDVLAPHQKQMAWRRFSPVRRLRKLRRIYGELEHLAEVLPRKVLDIVDQFHAGKIDVHLDHRGLEPSVNRLVLGMLASAVVSGLGAVAQPRSAAAVGPAWLFGRRFAVWRCRLHGVAGTWPAAAASDQQERAPGSPWIATGYKFIARAECPVERSRTTRLPIARRQSLVQCGNSNHRARAALGLAESLNQ